MRKFVLCNLILVAHYTGFSQIEHIQVVLGKTETVVTAYFDSLNSLKSNPYYKVKKSVTNYGELS